MKAENWRAAPYDYLDSVEHYCKQLSPSSSNAHLHLLKDHGKGKQWKVNLNLVLLKCL